MYWNYRLIDLSHKNAGEPWVEIHEVFYNDDDTLMGYTPATLGSEDVATMRSTLKMMVLALGRPALKVTDFKGD